MPLSVVAPDALGSYLDYLVRLGVVISGTNLWKKPLNATSMRKFVFLQVRKEENHVVQ